MSGFAGSFAIPTLFKAYRAIGSFTATVTVTEHHVDELVITEHPVEYGAAISDHAYKRPSEVRIEAGWDGGSSPVNVYTGLLALQASRQPFNIYTGKRAYSNMLIASLIVETDDKSENVLLVTAICRQVILVSTSTVQTPALNSSNMTMPSQTAPVQQQGSQQLNPANAAFDANSIAGSP